MPSNLCAACACGVTESVAMPAAATQTAEVTAQRTGRGRYAVAVDGEQVVGMVSVALPYGAVQWRGKSCRTLVLRKALGVASHQEAEAAVCSGAAMATATIR